MTSATRVYFTSCSQGPIAKPEPPGLDGISRRAREAGGWWVFRAPEPGLGRHRCSLPNLWSEPPIGSVWQCLVPTDPTRTWKRCEKRWRVMRNGRKVEGAEWRRYRGRIGRHEKH